MDVGIVNYGHFLPMPISAIALVLTVVTTLTDFGYLLNTEDENFWSVGRVLHQ
jgi:hypothetical protein